MAEEILRVPGPARSATNSCTLTLIRSSDGVPAATIKLRVDGEEKTVSHASGDGTVDACYKAITKITGSRSRLVRYSVNAITGGTDAQGEVSCLIEDGEHAGIGAGGAYGYHYGKRARLH